MKTLILFFIFLSPMLSINAQVLNSIKYEKQYKSITPVKVREKIKMADTIRVIDTVYLQKQLDTLPVQRLVMQPSKDIYSPLSSLRITSNYGMRFHPIKRKWLFHGGVDFDANKDTVVSVIDGVIHSSGYNSGLGYYVKVESGNYVITYAHLSQYFHLEKTNIKAGEQLGITGTTGLSTGEHLHFSVHHNGDPIDPINFLTSLIQIKSALAVNKSYEITRDKY